MISPLWGYCDVAPLGLLGCCTPSEAEGWGYWDVAPRAKPRGGSRAKPRGGSRAKPWGEVLYLSDFSSRLRSTSSFHAEASVHRAELKNSPRPTGTPLYEENEIHLLNYSFLSRHRIHGRSMMRKMFKFCQAWKITCMHGIVLPKDQISLR